MRDVTMTMGDSSPRPRHRLERWGYGALVERDFRLLFSATAITTAGDMIATIGLAFAVLEDGTATDLGLILGARQALQATVLVFGGVLSDRVSRSTVLVLASLAQGAAQGGTAALVVYGDAGLVPLLCLQCVYGAGLGLVLPAEVGLVPQTVRPELLQQANALQGITRNLLRVIGPALGGVAVAVVGPGITLAIDAASFFACAGILHRIRVRPHANDAEGKGFLTDMREGWQEFVSRSWLWASVVLFSVGNIAFAAWNVLGPVIAKAELGGAGAWAAILAAGGAGSVAGGVLAIHIRPRRPLAAAVLLAIPIAAQFLALAAGVPLWLTVSLALLAGAGMASHLALWFTVIQQQVPERAQSRVISYETLGSFILMPLGMVAAGPVAGGVGAGTALAAAALLYVVCLLAILSLSSVRDIRSPEPVVVLDVENG